MSVRGFWASVLAGLVFSAAGAIAFSALCAAVGFHAAARIVVGGIGVAWLVLLLRHPRTRIGRVVCAAGAAGLGASLAVLDPPLWLWAASWVASAWLVRSLYGYDSLRAALADAGITALAAAAGVAAARHTHSAFLAGWTFFLVQALTSLVPTGTGAEDDCSGPEHADEFDQAERTAQAALRRLGLPSTTTTLPGDHP